MGHGWEVGREFHLKMLSLWHLLDIGRVKGQNTAYSLSEFRFVPEIHLWVLLAYRCYLKP